MAKSPKSRRWTTVVNNCAPQDEETLQSIPCRHIAHGKEVGANGTPRLQGFVTFNSTKALVALKKLHATAHFEPANKTSETNANCCKKGEQPKEEWDEHRDDGPNFGLNCEGHESGDFPSSAGQRTDLDEIKDAIEDGMTNPRDLRKRHSNAHSNHRRFVAECVVNDKPFAELTPHPLRPWQEEVESILSGPVDERKTVFAVDKEGNAGESWLAEHHRQLHPDDTVVRAPGKKADVVHAAAASGHDPRVAILDVPRSEQSQKHGDTTESALMRDFLEEMKNDNILVTKCESCAWRLARPHVLVTTNRLPDVEALSRDRHHIILTGNHSPVEAEAPASTRMPPMLKKKLVASAIPGQTFPKPSGHAEEWVCPPGHATFTAQRKLEWHHFSGVPVRDPHKKGPRHNTSPWETVEDTHDSDSDKRETGPRPTLNNRSNRQPRHRDVALAPSVTTR